MRAIMIASLVLLLAAPMASATYFLHEDFENGGGAWSHIGETPTGGESLWHLETNRSFSGEWSAAYNTGYSSFNYDVGWNWGRLMTPVMDLSSASEVHFEFASWLETEQAPDEFDVAYVGYSTAPNLAWTYLHPDIQEFAQSEWIILGMDLTSVLAGESHAQICFQFDSVDDVFNDYEGWYIDDVMVYDEAGTPPIPEPSTLLLLGSGLLGLGAVTRRRFRK